jgi:predicted O-methyltransferase YrrM
MQMKKKLKKFIKFLLLPLLIKKSINIIKKRNTENYDLFKEIDFVFSPLFKIAKINLSIKPIQVKSEIFNLMNRVKKIKPKIVCEIGTARGGVLYLLTRVSAPDAVIISIDLPQGKFGGGYSSGEIPLYSSFAKNNQKMHLIRDDSHKNETLEKVKSILKDKEIDFLFIDGDHTYDGVRKDFGMYKELVKKGGTIAFHDIVYGSEEKVGGVPIFWNKIKKEYNYQEIVEDHSQGGYGIGIIFK